MAVEGVLVSKLRAAWLLLLLSPLSLLSFLVLLPAQAQALPSCPKRCSCPGQKEVHCTFRHFTSPPRNLPKDTERVNLGYNSLQALDGSEFTHLHQLEMLMLHGNDITTVSQGAFYSLRSLQILKLSYNKLKTVNPGILEGLVSLVRLHLDHNLITFIEPYSFTGLSSLKLLQLEGNQLADLHPHTFVTLSILGTFWGSSLRHLHLSDNRLQYLQAAVLQPLTRLEMLTLHGNPWTCDCQLHWLLEWNSKHEGVIKCKKERESGSSEICAACFSPQPLNGTQILGLATEKLPCLRPSIESPLKQWDSPGWNEDDSEPDLPYTRDLEQPLGKMTVILSDSHGNTAHVQCDVQRPSESSLLSWEPLRSPGELSVNVTLVSVLECEIDRDALQNLWRLVAYYHESPAILERGPRRENTTQVTFKYSQSANEDSPYFTDLKGHLMAKPAWLLQPRVTLQLNRRQTTTKKLVLDFTTVIFKHVGGRGQQEEEDGVDDISSSWALIQRGSGERIQTVLEGSEVNLECNVISSASPTVQWMLPDLSILEASNAVMAVSERGELVIGNASVSNAGLYHCLVRSQEGVDIVPVRLTVMERLLSPNAVNGKKMIVKSGESLSLPCSVTSTLPSVTNWYLPNHHALLPSQQTGRVSVAPNGTLLIRKVGHEDAGEYSCVASNLYGVDMLAHLLVVMEDREEEKTGVADTDRGKVLLLVDGEEDTEGSGFQEIKRHHTTQSPKKLGGGQQRNAGGGLRPGMKGKRVKDSKRKPNTSVKELDPNRWAEILAKANAKAPTAQSTAPPLTVPSTIRMATETTVTTPTTTAATTTSATTTTSLPPDTSPEKNIIEIDDTTSKPPTKSKSQVVDVTQTPHLPITRTMDKHAGDGRTGPKFPPGWTNRRRPPYRRGRPLLRPVHPLKPSTRKPHTILPQPSTVTTATTTTTTDATSKEDDQNTDESDYSSRVDSQTNPSQKSASSVYSDEEEGKDDSELLGATSTPDIIHAKSTVGKESGISKSQHFSRPNMMPTPEPHIRPNPISEVYIIEKGLDSSIEEVVVRQMDNKKQTTLLLATTTPSPTLSYDMNFKPPPLHHAVTMATSVLRNLDVLDSKAPENPIIKQHESYSPARHKEEDSTPKTSVTHDNPPRKDLLKPFHTNRDRKKEVEESFKPITESPRYTKPRPVHPWMQQHIQRRGQTQLSPRSPYHTPHKPSFLHPGGSRVQEGPLPVTHQPRPIPHLWGHGSWVTNRPEITAETVKPTAFISGSLDPLADPLTPQTPLISQTRDLILLSKLRNRYRQAQLDRIAQLGKRVTPRPRVAHPTPRPNLPLITTPTHLSWLVPATTSPPLPRVHPTDSILHGGHWNHGRWSPPQKQVTVLPFPGLMGNGAKPRITTVNTVSVSALAESDVFLSCEVSGDPAPALSWTKVSTGATIPANTKHGPRFEVLKNGTFVIKTVQLQDRGQYLCTAQNRFGSDRMVVTLAVLTQPPRILSPTSTEVSLYLGKSISLDCLASGKPPAQISWILPDRTFVRDVGIGMNRMGALLLPNGTLRIQSADFSNKGAYKCIASNAAGADTVIYHVHVAALPPTITEGTAESITIQPGKSVFVHCSAKGEPAPALKWTLAAGVHVKPSQFLGRRLFVFPNGTLYIRNILPVDAGKYECSATNVVGVAKRTLNLEVRQDQPNLRQPPLSPSLPQRQVVSHPTQQHKVTAMYGSTVYLHCPESTSSPRGTVWQLPSRTILEHRYSPERPVRAFPNGTLRILQLTEVDGGSYLCMFQRPNGEDMELFQVEVLMTPPKIEHMGTAQKRVTYGENFLVDCVASGLPDPEVTWSLPDGTVINNALQSDDSGTRSRRYVIFGNGTLLLQQMGKKDEGNYTCYAKNKLGEDERKVSVKVGPEAPRITKAQSSLIARLGESASLACPATGEPPPNILWLTSNNEVISTYTSAYLILADGTLVIKKVTASDQGTYTCVARNSVGEDVKNMKLEVQARAPHINDQGGRSSMKILAVSYQTTILDCKATGKPEPHLKWTTPYGLSLPTPYMGGRFQVHKNGSLELRGLRKSDEGLYVCLAKNQFGEASLSVDLEVASLAEKPSFAMPNIEILPIKQDGGAVMLECPARGKPNPEFVWILPNGTAMSPGAQFQRFTHYLGNGTLRISWPVATDKGVYRCLAKNVAGLAEKRYALEAGRKPIIRGTTGGMKITYGHSLNLPCTVDAWPQAAITWTLPNGLVLDKTQSIGRVTFLANGTLLLREIATFDRGTYVCKATNTFGSSTLSYPVAVMVYPPRITSAPASITRVNRGTPATLSCVAAGIPKPDITWTLPGRTTLVPNNRFTAQGGIHMTEEGSLVLQDPGLMNSGIYKCNAKNALGTDFKATYVQVI